MKKKLCALLAFLMMITGIFGMLSGCKNTGISSGDATLSQTDREITLENKKIRISFNKSNGSVREVYNKTAGISLVSDNEDAEAVSLRVKGETLMVNQQPEKSGFEYEVEEDGAQEKRIAFSWRFPVGATVRATASLSSGADEVVFRVRVSGMQQDVYAVQYPIVDNIGALTGNGDDDYIVSPFATGYLFRNPQRNFMRHGQDLSGQSAHAPSGFGSTMQFYGYYTQNKGGFYWQTKDGGNTVKDFTFKNDGGTLQAEIGHYVSDMSRSSAIFDYDIVLANLNEGNWYEAAERYKTWAEEQTWVKYHGKNSEREDLNKTVYENSVLANFIAPAKKDQSAYALTLYQKIRENITTPGSKILTVPFYYSIPQEVGPDDDINAYFETWKDDAFYSALAENGEPIAQFEYTDLQLQSKMLSLPSWISDNRVKKEYGEYWDIMFAENWQYLCGASERWINLVTSRQREQFEKMGMQGIYNDLGICAVHPLQCFDSTHSHGLEVNVLDDYLALLEKSHELSREYTVDDAGNCGFTGQEMIIENAIPFVDVYQARANAGEMSGMEHDQIMRLVENDVAEKIPLFEYIYHEYSGVRMDGFTLPVSSVGIPYYYTMAYTALNGGIPEFNYECYDRNALADLAGQFDADMIRFIDTLGKARVDYAKKFLVYGSMARSPQIGVEKQMYSYETPIVINWGNVGGTKSGEMLLSPVTVSAFRSGEEVAIFLCNVTGENMDLSFTLDAASLYGMREGSVAIKKDGTAVASGSLSEGTYAFSQNLDSRSVYMIVLSPEKGV